jgi:hypothetical protein
MKIDTIKYEGFDIELHYNKEMQNFYSTYKVGCSSKHNSIQDCLNDSKLSIDNFLLTCPKNYKELAENIHKTLVWHGYEECDVDEKILEHLVEQFIKYKNK